MFFVSSLFCLASPPTECMLLYYQSGTFHGYSALCIAQALPADGKVISIDSSLQSQKTAERNIKALAPNLMDKVQFVHSNATSFLQSFAALLQRMFSNTMKYFHFHAYLGCSHISTIPRHMFAK